MMPMELQSVAQFNTLLEEVFTDSKAKVVAASTDETSRWYQGSADGSWTISCSESAGTYTVTETLHVTTVEDGETFEGIVSASLVASGGYLTKMSVKNSTSNVWYETEEGAEPVKQEDKDLEENVYTFSYAFDQTAYNAIATTLPTEVEDYEGYSGYQNYVKAYINGLEMSNYDYVFEGATAEEALTKFLSEGGQWKGMNVTWYKDAACTQAITSSFTVEEMKALNVIYGQATLMEGNAFIIRKNKIAYAADVLDGYKFVLQLFNGGDNERIETYGAGNMSLYKYDEDMTIKVDGTTIDFGNYDTYSLTIEAGKTYIVEYITNYPAEGMNIFEML